MGSAATIAVAVSGISFLTFVVLFGRLPVLRHTPIAWLHRLILLHIPTAILALDRRLTSGKLTAWTGRASNYVMYDRHPTVLIFFLLLLSVSEYMFLPSAWPRLSLFHKCAGSLSVVLPYVFLYLAAAGDPGTITSANHARAMTLYPYDFTIFYPGNECPTCHWLKPARSKHCRICKRCISRMDHHCIFINNCVGANNYRWFILLLLTTGILTVYGAILGFSLMAARIRSHFPYWAFWPPHANHGRGMDLKQNLVIWSWALQGDVRMGAVSLLALLTSPLVWGLLLYHLWLIYCGTSTNETTKWSDWQLDINDGLTYKRRLRLNRAKNPRYEPIRARWPVESEQILLRTENGEPPPTDTGIPGVGDWELVWKLHDVENLYDLGFWDNLVDILLPNRRFRSPTATTARAQRRRHPKKRAAPK